MACWRGSSWGCAKKYSNLCVAGLRSDANRKSTSSEEYSHADWILAITGQKEHRHYLLFHIMAARRLQIFLKRQEYIGDTVNFRSTTRSFKDKNKNWTTTRRMENLWGYPRSYYWQGNLGACADTSGKQNADQTAQARSVCFRDCFTVGIAAKKLYYSVTNNYSREQAYFFCSNYRKNTANCTAHYIREKVVYALVIESLRRVLFLCTGIWKAIRTGTAW